MKFPAYVNAFLSVPSTVTDADILPAFRVFDPQQQGLIEAETIMKSLTTVGEALTEAEAKTFQDNLRLNEQGQFDYNGKSIMMNERIILINLCKHLSSFG